MGLEFRILISATSPLKEPFKGEPRTLRSNFGSSPGQGRAAGSRGPRSSPEGGGEGAGTDRQVPKASLPKGAWARH